MRALPFACVRAAEQAADMKTVADVDRLIEEGAYLRDGSPSYFVWQVYSKAAGPRTGLLCACSVGEFIKDADENAAVDARTVDRILDLGYQDEPVIVERPNEPVLAMIMSAAATGTPVYSVTLSGKGADASDAAAPGDDAVETHTLWAVKRGEALDALHELLARTEGAHVADPNRFAAVVSVARALRDEAKAEGDYTGREPFNWFTAALFTADAIAAGTPRLPEGLILRAMR